jgi:hypothetical protein
MNLELAEFLTNYPQRHKCHANIPVYCAVCGKQLHGSVPYYGFDDDAVYYEYPDKCFGSHLPVCEICAKKIDAGKFKDICSLTEMREAIKDFKKKVGGR